MRIARSGSERHHGVYEIALKELTVVWDPQRHEIRLSCYGVEDFDTPAHHDYELSLQLTELRQALDAVGEALSGESAPLIASALAPSLRAVLRIAVACVGPLGTSKAPDSPKGAPDLDLGIDLGGST